MSSEEFAIQVHHVSKTYQIYERPQHRLWQGLFRGHRRYYKEFWALKNVSFDVKKGEVVGIIGRNGSGKSTLLQIISGTLTPSTGTVSVGGRVAALLELGTGFNPEFTGRENVIMYASLLGLTQQEIDAKYPDIVEFADIHEFIDQAVKTYSSGMSARLAFAVAISVEPEILIIDEILSVGDEAFQRKCFGRIQEIRQKGTSIILVSHWPGMITELCDRAFLLDHGELLLSGEPKYVLSRYQRLAYAPIAMSEDIRSEIRKLSDGENVTSVPTSNQSQQYYPTKDFFDPSLISKSTVEYMNRGCQIVNVRVMNSENEKVNVLNHGQTYKYVYDVNVIGAVYNARFAMLIKSVYGIDIGGIVSHPVDQCITHLAAGTCLTVEFYFRALLNPGMFFMNAGALGNVDGEETFLHRIIDALAFRVQHDESSRTTAYVDFSVDPVCRIFQ